MRARHRATGALLLLVATAIVAGAEALGHPDAVALGALAALAALIGAGALLAQPRPRTAELDAALADFDARIEQAAAERLAMRMRAETAGRFREEFVSAVRHELKTPLNSILGFASVLLQEVDGPLTPAQREDVEAIRAGGHYLNELVEAVLEEWAPQRDEDRGLREVDLGQLARDVTRLLAGQVIDKEIELVVDVAEELPPVFADSRRLRQILINLGTNAIRATARGKVTISAALAGADAVRLTVRDTGRGISPDDLPRLFEEFEQLGPTAQRRGGAGLGLALTREAVEWHGGHIEVESRPGEGTAFHVTLPREVD